MRIKINNKGQVVLPSKIIYTRNLLNVTEKSSNGYSEGWTGLMNYLDGFKKLFWEITNNKLKDENPSIENEDSDSKKYRMGMIKMETDVVTDEVVDYLSDYVKRFELDVGELVR